MREGKLSACQALCWALWGRVPLSMEMLCSCCPLLFHLMGWWWSVMAGSPGNSSFSDSEENFKRRKPGNACALWEALVTAPNPPPQSAFPPLTLLSFPLQPLWSGRTGCLLTPLLNPLPEPSTHLCYQGPLSWFPPSPPYLSSLILISLCPPVLASVDSTNTTG